MSATTFAAGQSMFACARVHPVPGSGFQTNVPRDEMIGRLLERTEEMSVQLKESRATQSALDRTLNSLQGTIERLNTTVQSLNGDTKEHAEMLADYAPTKARLLICEAEIEKWAKLRAKVVSYAIWIALLAITSGTFGGTLLRNALGIH